MSYLKQLYADQSALPHATLPAVPLQNAPTFARPHHSFSWQRLVLLALFCGLVLIVSLYAGQRHYLLTSFLLMGGAFGAVCLRFERRHPTARELVVIAVLIALAVAGRSAFFMLAQFKPVAAVVIISGVAFGGDVGFLVGAMSALTSNIFFTQGPWTPWQMLAFGCVGYLAGLLSWAKLLPPKRLPLCLFGFLSVFLIYGGIMNPAAIIMYGGSLNKLALLGAYVAGAPMDLVHAFATFLFLGVLGLPMLRQLARLQLKYGLFAEN